MTSSFNAKEVTKLLLAQAAPFLLTRFIEVGSDFGAMMMLANLGDSELAASALISSVQAFLRGVFATNLYSVAILSAGLIGAANLKQTENDFATAALKNQEVGCFYRAGLKLAFLSSVVPILISVFIGNILQVGRQSKISSDLAQDYFRGYVFSFFPNLIFVVHQQIAQAAGCPWTVFSFTVLNRVITLGVAACLMYQAKMGAKGLGYGYAVGAAVSAMAFMGYLYCHQHFSKYRLFESQVLLQASDPTLPIKSPMRKLLDVGWPIAGYATAELGSILFLTGLLGSLSDSFLKMAQPSLQYTSFLANLIFAFGQGAAILLSRLYGEKKNLEAQKVGGLSIVLGFVLPLSLLILSFAIPNQMNAAFIQKDEDVSIFLGAQWFLIAGFATQLFDALRNMSAGTNRGLAGPKCIGPVMSRAPMLQTIFGILCINIPLSLGLAYGLSLGGKAAFIGRGCAIAISSGMIFDTWLKTKSRPTNNKLTLAQVFFPRIVPVGRLPVVDQPETEPCLPK